MLASSENSSPPGPSSLDGLNDRQLEAALHVEGPILILAGAGSGKTRVLTHRIAHLVRDHDVAPQNILAVTFTNKAANEMKERLTQLLGMRARQLWAATFHSTGLRILRRHAKLLSFESDFVVYDTQDSKNVIKQLMREMNIDDNDYSPQDFQKAIDKAKNAYVFPEDYLDHSSSHGDQVIAEVYDRYQRLLLKSNAMDFGDLLVNTVRLFEENIDTLRLYQEQLQYILVDEFQDTNPVQYRLVRLLAAPQNNLFVVGDDDQSIYAFRGATIQNILHFENDFPETNIVKLEQNYRSTSPILDSANSVIAKNKNRKSKKLWTAQEGGELIQTYCGYDDSDEANFIAREIQFLSETRPLSEIALFYRTNAQSRALEEALMSREIPYRIYGGLKFYDRKEIKDILGYLRLIANPVDSQAYHRIVNTPPRGIGPRSVQAVEAFAREADVPLLEATREMAGKSKGLNTFVSLMAELSQAASEVPLYELVEMVIEKSGYVERLQSSKDVTAQSRLENLEELKNIAAKMSNEEDSPEEDLQSFLDRVSLTSSEELPVEDAKDAEGQTPEKRETVSLMTLHLAKGLEFPVVFFTGLEEGLVPHQRSMGDEFSLSEERRLCYVGMTRAMQRLYLTRAERRGMFSAASSFGAGGMFREASRFANDIPQSYLAEGSDVFLYGRRVGDDDEEEFFDFESSPIETRSFRKKRSKKRGASAVLGGLKTADSLEKSAVSFEEYSNAPKASLSDLTVGKRVIHRMFGFGTIEKVDGDIERDAQKVKFSVKFDEFDNTKKLVFKHAKLGVVHDS